MKKILITAVCLSLLAANCKEDENPVDDHTHVDGNTVVSTSFHWKWGVNDFDTAQTYTTALGEKIVVDRVRFFLAQPYFQDDNGGVVAEFPAKYLLIDTDDGALIQNIGEVNGHLHTLHFTLGLDSATNHSDPTLASAPLSPSDMHWSWNDGYIFLNVVGRYDSDNDGDVDNNDQGFSYHCAGDNLKRPFEVEIHTDAINGGALVVDMDLDLSLVLNDKDISATPFSDGDNAFTRALVDDLQTSITIP